MSPAWLAEFGAMRNLIPEAGGRFINPMDVRINGARSSSATRSPGRSSERPTRRRQDRHLSAARRSSIVGVLQKKVQNSSYNSRDEGRAYMPGSTFRALTGAKYVNNFIYQPVSPSQSKAVTESVRAILARQLRFDPKDKEALSVWDTAQQFKFLDIFFLSFRLFLGIVGCFTLVVGGIGVSNIMNVVVEERMKEIGIKMALGARQRWILRQFLLETVLITALGGAIGFAISWASAPCSRSSERRNTSATRRSPSRSPLLTALVLGVTGLSRRVFPGAGRLAPRPRRGDEAVTTRHDVSVVAASLLGVGPAAEEARHADDRLDRLGNGDDPAAARLRGGIEAPALEQRAARWARTSPSTGRARPRRSGRACRRGGPSSRASTTSPCCASGSPKLRRLGRDAQLAHGASPTGERRSTRSVAGANWIYGDPRKHYPRPGGRFLDALDEEEKRRVVFLGDELAEDIFGKEDPVGKTLLINNSPFTVIGVMQKKTQTTSYGSQDKGHAVIPITTYKALIGRDKLWVLVIHTTTRRGHGGGARPGQRGHGGASYGYDPKDEHVWGIWNTVKGQEMSAKIFLGMEMFFGIIGALTLIIGCVGVANIMYAVVKERTREIGVKMALGARRGWITGPFLLEGLIYTFLGGPRRRRHRDRDRDAAWAHPSGGRRGARVHGQAHALLADRRGHGRDPRHGRAFRRVFPRAPRRRRSIPRRR